VKDIQPVLSEKATIPLLLSFSANEAAKRIYAVFDAAYASHSL
jgi:hypothetical protein